MKNIAEMAGVDKSIVSKVINGGKSIPASREKIELVQRIVKEYNYTPNGAALALATNRTNQVAFLLSSTTEALFASPAFGQMFSGVVRACREHHYLCQADICDFMNINDFVVPENLRRRNVDGCILTGNINDEALSRIAELEIPLVLLGGEYIRDQVASVTWKSLEIHRKIFDLFQANGHEYVWFANYSQLLRDCFEKLLPGYPRLKLEVLPQSSGDEIQDGLSYAERFAALPGDKRPTLVYGCDQFCCAFVSAIAKRGFKCPDDVSILCSSETEMAQCFNPPLSTFSQNYSEVGYMGGRLLIDILKDHLSVSEGIARAREYAPEGRYIPRDSIKSINKSTRLTKGKEK